METLFFQTTFPLAWKKDSHFCAILSISWPSWFIISTTQVHNPYLMVQLLSAFDISMRTYFLNYSSHFYKVNVFAQFQFLRYRPVFCSPYFFSSLKPKWDFNIKILTENQLLNKINHIYGFVTFFWRVSFPFELRCARLQWPYNENTNLVWLCKANWKQGVTNHLRCISMHRNIKMCFYISMLHANALIDLYCTPLKFSE